MPFLAAIPAAAAISGAGSAIGGIAGAAAGASKEAQAQAAQQKAIQYLESVGVPSVEAQKITLQNPEFVYQFHPEAQTAEQLGPSAMQNVSTDPRAAAAQMGALSQLQQLGQDSFTPEEQAQLNGMRRNAAQSGQAQQASILQNMQQRGAGGSGMELAARLASSQQNAQNQSEEGDRMAAMAHDRALQAMVQAGQLGGNVRSQEFGEGAQKANAADVIAQFNAMNKQNVQGQNVNSANSAAQQEALMKQQAENNRAGTANAQEQYNKQLLQQNYQNQMDKAKTMSGVYSGQADEARKQGAAAATNAAAAGTAAGGLLGQAAGTKSLGDIFGKSSGTSDEEKKKLAGDNPFGQS